MEINILDIYRRLFTDIEKKMNDNYKTWQILLKQKYAIRKVDVFIYLFKASQTTTCSYTFRHVPVIYASRIQ